MKGNSDFAFLLCLSSVSEPTVSLQTSPSITRTVFQVPDICACVVQNRERILVLRQAPYE